MLAVYECDIFQSLLGHVCIAQNSTTVCTTLIFIFTTVNSSVVHLQLMQLQLIWIWYPYAYNIILPAAIYSSCVHPGTFICPPPRKLQTVWITFIILLIGSLHWARHIHQIKNNDGDRPKIIIYSETSDSGPSEKGTQII